MTTGSYLDKTFVVENPDARIRRDDDLHSFVTLSASEAALAGGNVGDFKRIPVDTKIRVLGTRIGPNGVVYVQAATDANPPTTIGWTSSRNLRGQFVNETLGEVDPTDNDPRGATAAWAKGNFVGQKKLVNIVDSTLEVEQIALETLPAYLRLVAAAEQSKVTVALRSGFRTYAEQAYLYEGFKNHKAGFATAARPGFSNHQHGQAFDLNVGGFQGNPVYDWLSQNGPKFGFIRTVSGEPWHWEYRPEMAAQLAAKGKHKLAGIV
ncbi:M15 family metallopeptidase [Mesorhizobium sp. LjNodule214]|uniref:M15 family metallopeptidase n=1 Tax=Mesorhizobium sp. LjNodule214 TaxID=3342252 RepID=UPI003ECF70FD